MNELSGSCWVFTALSPSAGSSAYATAENAPAQPGVSMPAKPGTSESASASAAASINAAVSVRADPKAAPHRAAREAADQMCIRDSTRIIQTLQYELIKFNRNFS